MPRFFKRSAKVPITSCQLNDNDNSETCAFDTYRVRSGDQPLDIVNQNRLIENESNAERLTGSTSSVGERVSNFVNGIIGKMGKNRRKNKLNQQPIQQQQQQQSHLKKIHTLNEKQAQHGKINQRQPPIKKGQNHEFYSHETATENNKSVPVSFDVNIKSEHVSKGSNGSGGGGGGVVLEEKLHRKLHDSKNNMKNQHNANIFHCDTFNADDDERVKPKSASDCIGTNASDCQSKNRAHPITAVTNEIDKLHGPLDERIIKNSLYDETTTALHSCIEIDSSISGVKNNLNRSEFKQLTPHSNNHISSSADANNNEVNIVVEKIGDVRSDSNVAVNRDTANLNSKQSAVEQGSERPLEKIPLPTLPHGTVHKTQQIKPFTTFAKKTQPPSACNRNNSTRTMGQYQSTTTANKTNLKQPSYKKTKNHESDDTKANSEPTTQAATAQAPQNDKNKNNFSNELNEILETETSSKQSGAELKPEPETNSDVACKTAANEIKDVFYETSSNLNSEINSTVFVSDGKSVNTPQYTGTVTENVNGNTDAFRFESHSNGTKNNHKVDTKISLENDKVDVTSATNRDTLTATVEAAAAATTTATTAATTSDDRSSENDSERNVKNVDDDQCRKNSSVGANKKIENQRDSESECGANSFKPSHLKQNCEQSAQMEQNVLYRVDSYNSDEALELSDIEETVIDQNGKVIEVKTLFKQRPASKSPVNSVQFNKKDNPLDAFRTINCRRRSNSITGTLGIEIVEVNVNSNNAEFLTQLPYVSFADDSNAIKLSDLHDNSKGNEKDTDHAIDIVEIVEESESGSEYEEIEEEIEEEEIEEEIEEEEEEEELVSADCSLSFNDSATDDKINHNTKNAFNSSPNGVNNSQQSIPHTATAQYTRTSHQNNDNDVICVLVNGQPTRFNANTTNNLSQTKNTEPISHSHSRFNENDLKHSPLIDKSQKFVSDKIGSVKGSSSGNAYEKSSESKQQHHPPKYSDDAMHLPDIVVGSTLHGLNVNSGIKKSIPLSRSPPKIVVNDNTLDSWTSNEDETGTISDSFDESIEVDEEASDLTDDDAAEKSPSEKRIYPNALNISNKNEINDSQNIINNEAKQHELNLLAQINEAKTTVSESQVKISDLTYKISELDRNLSVKSWNVDRLQAELEAAYKELNCVKMKLKLQEAELEALRTKHSDKEDDFNINYNKLQGDHIDLKQKLDQMQSLAISLQVQLSSAHNDLSDVRAEKEKLIKERDVERQALQDALDAAIIERAENDAKWQRDFEQLRTLNSDREELLLQDCEWKIRSTERLCKDRMNAAEKAKQEALKQSEKIAAESKAQLEKVKHLKVCEAEVTALRGLTNEQRQSIAFLTNQLEEMKTKLDETSCELEEAAKKIHKMAIRFASDLSDKDREMIARLDEARCEVALMWEDRLMNEMLRLKEELETCFAEDRIEAVQKSQKEHIDDVGQLKESFAFREKLLQDEVEAIRSKLADRNRRLDEANEKADKQIMQIRMILNKSEQGHQREFQSQTIQHEREIERLKEEFEEKVAEMKADFDAKIAGIKRKSTDDLNTCKAELLAKLKKDYDGNYEKFKADKEEELLDMQRNYKRKLSDADVRMRDVEILHHREIKDLQNAHSMERSSLEKRDLQNSQEIETLHRKCRCLTKLFEEMRLRYERREPRAEDVRAIEELKGVIDAQDRDLRILTEKLREMQMHDNGVMCDPLNFEQQQMMMQPVQPASHIRKMKKPTLNCDVIYEAENEEEESRPISA